MYLYYCTASWLLQLEVGQLKALVIVCCTFFMYHYVMNPKVLVAGYCAYRLPERASDNRSTDASPGQVTRTKANVNPSLNDVHVSMSDLCQNNFRKNHRL